MKEPCWYCGATEPDPRSARRVKLSRGYRISLEMDGIYESEWHTTITIPRCRECAVISSSFERRKLAGEVLMGAGGLGVIVAILFTVFGDLDWQVLAVMFAVPIACIPVGFRIIQNVPTRYRRAIDYPPLQEAVDDGWQHMGLPSIY
jgi:hypothetical protein